MRMEDFAQQRIYPLSSAKEIISTFSWDDFFLFTIRQGI